MGPAEEAPVRAAEGVPVVILCGGRGTRIGEASRLIPKPMLEIGGRPILWHVMKLYDTFGFTQFVLALGYLGDVIRRFFLHYEALTRDFTIDIGNPGEITYLQEQSELGWQVTCVDTGLDTLTGTRVRQAVSHLPDGPIMVTYGDGVGDIDLGALLAFHRSHGGLATITAVHPPGRFGELVISDDYRVDVFDEKPQTSSGEINGGFMVLEREAINRYVPAGENLMLEREPLNALARDGQLFAYKHDGFWQPMDTVRERDLLEGLWASGKAPWKLW